MIVIHKRKILLILGIVVMFIFTYIITGYNISNNKVNNDMDIKTVQTVALPVDNKVIIIDAGHGVPDEGAESSSRNNRSRE